MKSICHSDEDSPFPAWGEYLAPGHPVDRWANTILLSLFLGIMSLFILNRCPAVTESDPQPVVRLGIPAQAELHALPEPETSLDTPGAFAEHFQATRHRDALVTHNPSTTPHHGN